jgi:hypothetical protein
VNEDPQMYLNKNVQCSMKRKREGDDEHRVMRNERILMMKWTSDMRIEEEELEEMCLRMRIECEVKRWWC